MLCSLAEDYEQHSKAALANPDYHLGNPVNAFLLVKRFTTDFDSMLDDYVRVNNSEGNMVLCHFLININECFQAVFLNSIYCRQIALKNQPNAFGF